MKFSLITMRSVTGAMKGQKVLSANGIHAEIVRLPAQFSDAGCTYGLELAADRDSQAIHILRVSDVPYEKLIRNP